MGKLVHCVVIPESDIFGIRDRNSNMEFEFDFPYLRAFKTVYTGNRMTDITVFSDRIEKKITDRCHSNWRSV